ncbi:hypothetical protein [Metabacillus arenae]|uniref:Uncharacterized protein n=1 Tax=Metabacillus arenae TaxID=2771434 RepID=A0A926NKB6_9BACI|nr:hypothetical protein [Metabacillus arenae]MBD1382183.1 hypothetical protein [Metabacillus arenae]
MNFEVISDPFDVRLSQVEDCEKADQVVQRHLRIVCNPKQSIKRIVNNERSKRTPLGISLREFLFTVLSEHKMTGTKVKSNVEFSQGVSL